MMPKIFDIYQLFFFFLNSMGLGLLDLKDKKTNKTNNQTKKKTLQWYGISTSRLIGMKTVAGM